jgi:hypothetical protein
MNFEREPLISILFPRKGEADESAAFLVAQLSSPFQREGESGMRVAK